MKSGGRCWYVLKLEQNVIQSALNADFSFASLKGVSCCKPAENT